MATLLSRIFGKKVDPSLTQDSSTVHGLDVSAFTPLMTPPVVQSTDPKDISGAWTMEQVTTVFPSSQRALFRRYHIGGCSSCGFQPSDTLGTVAVNHRLDVNEVVGHLQRGQETERDLGIPAGETAEVLEAGQM